jgi:hypothetical protein
MMGLAMFLVLPLVDMDTIFELKARALQTILRLLLRHLPLLQLLRYI